MTTIRDQLHAARTRALVVEETDKFGVLVARGGDRRSWLNGLVTCDLAKLAPGKAVYGLAVTPKGKVLADILFLDDADRILLLVPMSQVEAVAQAFDHYLVMEDAELEAAPAAYRVFAVHGPESAPVLEAGATAGALVGAVDRFGLGGGLAVADGAAAEAVRGALEQAVARVGGAVGDAATSEALRLEHGVPRFGADFGPSTYPQEAGLEGRAVSFDKGCYLGQEIVCMLQLRGHVKRKLVSLALEDGEAAPGAPIVDGEGQTVGELTSVVRSPSLGRPVALGMVKLAFAAPGTELRVGGAKGRVVEPPVAAG